MIVRNQLVISPTKNTKSIVILSTFSRKRIMVLKATPKTIRPFKYPNSYWIPQLPFLQHLPFSSLRVRHFRRRQQLPRELTCPHKVCYLFLDGEKQPHSSRTAPKSPLHTNTTNPRRMIKADRCGAYISAPIRQLANQYQSHARCAILKRR